MEMKEQTKSLVSSIFNNAFVVHYMKEKPLYLDERFADGVHGEHRLEKVAVIDGVEYINDSKATNVNSVWFALEQMEKPVIWIAGGIDRGNDYEIIRNLVKTKVKVIINLAYDPSHIKGAFKNHLVIFSTTRMQEAVQIASKVATKGDVVLLSPACASFDLFDNYEDRGKQFRESVLSKFNCQ